MQSVHREGVLGERVEVSFDEGDWYLGTIEEMKTSLKDGALAYKHFVRFDDGDKKWLDLAEEEKLKQLRWPSKVGAKRVADPVGAPPSPVKKSSKAQPPPSSEKSFSCTSTIRSRSRCAVRTSSARSDPCGSAHVALAR